MYGMRGFSGGLGGLIPRASAFKIIYIWDRLMKK